MGLSEWCYANLPGKGLDKARQNRRAAHKVARQLLDMKSEALLSSKGSRDVMSIIGRCTLDTYVVEITRIVLSASECIGGRKDQAR